MSTRENWNWEYMGSVRTSESSRTRRKARKGFPKSSERTHLIINIRVEPVGEGLQVPAEAGRIDKDLFASSLVEAIQQDDVSIASYLLSNGVSYEHFPF